MHFLELRQDIIEKINVIIANDIQRSYYFHSDDVNIERFLRKVISIKDSGDFSYIIAKNKPENILANVIDVTKLNSPFLFGINSTEEELFYLKMKYC